MASQVVSEDALLEGGEGISLIECYCGSKVLICNPEEYPSKKVYVVQNIQLGDTDNMK